MKRIISLALAMILCLGLLTVGTSAESASGYFSGPSEVRAGDTITLTFSANGSGIIGLDGTISYDSSMLTLVSTSQKIGSSWLVEFNGTKFVAYDNTQENPINGSAGIFAAKFQVNESLTPGTHIAVSCTGITASDGNADVGIDTVTYSTVLLQPKEQNLDLQSLSVSNGMLSPAFQSSVTEYTVTIPASDSKVNLTAVPVDSTVNVKVSNTSVPAGSTKNITVTVTGENGATKVYTISATRLEESQETRPTETTDPTQPSTTVPEETDPTQPSATVPKETEPVGETEPATNPTQPSATVPKETEPMRETEPATNPTQPSATVPKGTEPVEETEATTEQTQPQTEATTDEAGTEASSDLKSLEVIGGALQPGFQSDITEYTVEVSGSVGVEDIIAKTVDPEARVQVTTQAAADDGTQHLAVTVIGGDGSTKTYNITVMQNTETPSAYKCGFGCPCMWLWVVTMVLLIAVVIVMFVLYGKLRKEKK